jgi:acetyl-CoA acyltransferase
MQDAVIVAAARTPVGKAPNGSLRTVRPDEMAATVMAEVLRRVPAIQPSEIDDVIVGCAMPEAEQGLNVARIASIRAGIPVEASAVTINRFCSSGLQSIAFAAERIMCGSATNIIAGGTESMSMVPMGGNKVSPNPALVDSYPDVYLSTGLVAENHARESGISREEQDAFALRSHQRALASIDAGRFREEIVPITVRLPSCDRRFMRPVPSRPAIRRRPATGQPRSWSPPLGWPESAASSRSPDSSHSPPPASNPNDSESGQYPPFAGRSSRPACGWNR